jgi:thermitase
MDTITTKTAVRKGIIGCSVALIVLTAIFIVARPKEPPPEPPPEAPPDDTPDDDTPPPVLREAIVAVLDTGIDYNHQDLAGRVVDSINFSSSPTDLDVNGHGTHVAGVIAGMAPAAKIINVKVVDDSMIVSADTVAQGIIWSVDNGARIINMSFELFATSPALEQALYYAWSKGAVLIAAAGNYRYDTPIFPACYDNVIAVAALNSDGSLWAGSQYSDWAEAFAPGVDIYSTLPNNSYGYSTGTSEATAHVSGAAAVYFSSAVDANHDGLVNDEVAYLLKTDFALR